MGEKYLKYTYINPGDIQVKSKDDLVIIETRSKCVAKYTRLTNQIQF
jgi:hypothetical protein